jgi:hypothetical protein
MWRRRNHFRAAACMAQARDLGEAAKMVDGIRGHRRFSG